ncbi:MAG: phosphate acyltransferase PlsX [Clostridiales bacterium]|nr:phosphate acyltransferase PlsX [Clostridiales bacterium]
MKVVVDAFGGDNAPLEVVEGAVLAIKQNKDLTVVLTGDEIKIKEILGDRIERIEIVDAKDVVTNEDSPTIAIRQKKDSSLVRAFDLLKTDETIIGLVSAGSTGAILAGAIMKIGRIKGISRPALAPILPTKTDRDVIIVDSGANVDCKSENLLHFAIMGSAYYSIIAGEKAPRVALLNNGAEEHKGNELTKETYPLMKTLPINFVGNSEAREVMSGDVDVIVCDGFAGNVLLKGVEGTASAILSTLKKEVKASFWAKIGYLFMKGAFKKLKTKLDINKHGGAPFLGCKKLIVKNHGSCGRDNICASIMQVIKLHENKLNEKIEAMIQDMTGKVGTEND